MADLPFPCAYRGKLWCAFPWPTASPSRYVRFPRPRCGFPSVPIVNVELHENMEFACPPSIPPSGAQRASRVGRRRVDGLQIPSRTPFGESRATAPIRTAAGGAAGFGCSAGLRDVSSDSSSTPCRRKLFIPGWLQFRKRPSDTLSLRLSRTEDRFSMSVASVAGRRRRLETPCPPRRKSGREKHNPCR